MESSSDDSQQMKLLISSMCTEGSSTSESEYSDDDEEEERPRLTPVAKEDRSPHNTPTRLKLGGRAILHGEHLEPQDSADDSKASGHRGESMDPKPENAGLSFETESSDVDQQEEADCSGTRSPPNTKNSVNTKPWTVRDVTILLKELRKQLPKTDNKGCLHTAKKIDWNSVAFDCFSAEDCKKEFSILLENIKLMKTMTAVINELEEKIPSGKLKTFLILQPRQQFVRDFAEKNKGIVSGSELFSKSASAWKKLSVEEKEQYTREYIKAKEKEIAIMSEDEPPQRPKIPFELYYEDLCKKKGQKNLNLKSMAREKYKALDPKKKIKYIALSAIELYTYELQVANYLKKQPDWNVPVQRGPSKEDSEMYLKHLGMPPRPPNTASLLYYHQKLKSGELDHIHGTTRLFYAVEQFRKLSDHKKKKYKEKHKEMLQEYALEFEQWRKKQNEVVQRLADKLLGKKQILPPGTLCRLQEHEQLREKKETATSPCGQLANREVHQSHALFRSPCCRHQREEHSREEHPTRLTDQYFPPPDMQRLKHICKQDVFFNADLPLEEKMENIALMISGYEYLPNKARNKFDTLFKKWRYSLEASIIVDVKNLDKNERLDFLIKYRSLCKRFFKWDIFHNVFPIEKYPHGCKKSQQAQDGTW